MFSFVVFAGAVAIYGSGSRYWRRRDRWRRWDEGELHILLANHKICHKVCAKHYHPVTKRIKNKESRNSSITKRSSVQLLYLPLSLVSFLKYWKMYKAKIWTETARWLRKKSSRHEFAKAKKSSRRISWTIMYVVVIVSQRSFVVSISKTRCTVSANPMCLKHLIMNQQFTRVIFGCYIYH